MRNDLNDNIRQLQRQFLESLPQKAHQLEDLWHHLRHFNWSEQGFKTFHQLVHRLVGTCATFGLPEISNAAHHLDSYLMEHKVLSQPIGGIEFEMIDQMLNVLTRTLGGANSSLSIDEVHVDSIGAFEKHVYLIEADHSLSSLMRVYLQAAGLIVKHFDTASACFQHLTNEPPDAILIDPGIAHDGNLAFDAVLQITKRLTHEVPILFLSARSDIHSRLRALRTGCATYITKPIDYNALVKTLIQSIENSEITYKIMIVDDEEIVATYHAEILRHAGMEVICVSHPMQSLQRAAEFKPDLVLLDMHMPEINGIELATLLRQDEQFLLLPIIFVTADTSMKLRQSIESLGVNGLLTKPVDMGALVNACERAINDTFSLKHRIESITQRAQHNNQITRSYFFAAIENELQEDRSNETPTALYYIGLDIDEKTFQTFGPAGVTKLHEQFCQFVAQMIGSEEQWSDLSNFVVCVLVSKRTRAQHQKRVNQIADHLSSLVYNVGDDMLILSADLGVHFLEGASESANSALLRAEKAYEQRKKSRQPSESTTTNELEESAPHSITIANRDYSPDENLRVCYQPMISLDHSEIEHYEALVRWRISDDELVPAAKFLHYLEHSILRSDLDRWVLQSAVNTMAADHYARENACLFIHLANETFAQPNFFEYTAEVLRLSCLRGQRQLIFVFEEPWIALHLVDAANIISSLHKINCGACLSHAGATAANEAIIQAIEFDYIRLSPSLTSNLDSSSEQVACRNKLVAVAKKAGADVIATQVEDSKNLSTLWMEGIRLFQGFLLQTPDQSIHSHNEADILKKLFPSTH